jgi:flavin reductase (DIM6/NTAB) family NADH-FMN oxidoreductase RutF
MFYEANARDPSLLPYDPFKALVAPRPVGWVSTMDVSGRVNLAPYSFFNGLCSRPNIVAFSSEGDKDSCAFARESGEFVWNMATFALRNEMNATSAPLPRGDSEFVHAGLETAPSRLVRPPRVAASPAALECKVLDIVRLKDLEGRTLDNFVVFGQVVGVHIDDRFIKNGLVDTAAMAPIARCGYQDYAVVDKVFAIVRPTSAQDAAAPTARKATA